MTASHARALTPALSRKRERELTPLIAPGAMLGVVGGGQLGRMFAHAAQRAGYRVAVLDPDRSSPAGAVAELHIAAAFDDSAAIERLAGACAAVTIEFENVPAATLAVLARSLPVVPGAAAVSVCQDRTREKSAFAAAGIAAAPHVVIGSPADLHNAGAALFPAILKTARLGYDGKGQAAVASPADLAAAFAAFGGVACVLEKRLALAAELSVVVARSRGGDAVHLPVQENTHRDGILAITRVPAPAVAAALQAEAVAQAKRLAEALDYTGVLCVEFFLTSDGSLVANEMAPRAHNSGHHSIDSCDLSQFDLQVRALVGAPLVAPRQHSPAVMLNLLGDLWQDGRSIREPDWAPVLALAGAHLHLYGKREPRAGRKMGHLTLTAPTRDAAEATARRAAALLGIVAQDSPGRPP